MVSRQFAAAALAALWLMAGAAWAAPDFTGNWKLNASKSDFGQMPAPDRWDMAIEHKEPALKVTTTMAGQMGERTTTTDYNIGGPETESTRGEWKSKSTAKWQDGTLHIISKISTGNGELTIDEKWTLIENGKALSITSKWISQMGEFEAKRVMDKQ